MKFTKITLGLVAVAACAASASAMAGEAATPVAIPTPPTGKGQIVFFRPGGMVGVAMGCSVNENGQKVSSLGAGKYFVMVTEPGAHQFSVKSEAKDVLSLEVEADETQYASCKIKMGIMMGRPDIRPATAEEFRAKSLKMVDVEDMGPAPGALRPEQIAAALAAHAEPAVISAPTEVPAATGEKTGA